MAYSGLVWSILHLILLVGMITWAWKTETSFQELFILQGRGLASHKKQLCAIFNTAELRKARLISGDVSHSLNIKFKVLTYYNGCCCFPAPLHNCQLYILFIFLFFSCCVVLVYVCNVLMIWCVSFAFLMYWRKPKTNYH